MELGINIGVRVVPTLKVGTDLLDWIPVNNRSCVVRLQGLVGVPVNSCVERSLFLISAYAPTNCSTDMKMREFNDTFASRSEDQRL